MICLIADDYSRDAGLASPALLLGSNGQKFRVLLLCFVIWTTKIRLIRTISWTVHRIIPSLSTATEFILHNSIAVFRSCSYNYDMLPTNDVENADRTVPPYQVSKVKEFHYYIIFLYDGILFDINFQLLV